MAHDSSRGAAPPAAACNEVSAVETDIEASPSDENGTSARDNAHETRDESSEKPEDVPPEGGYGWVCVACAAVINGNTWGVNSSYGVFLSYYLENDVFEGMSPIAYALTGGLSMSCCLLISPLVTHLIHLYGNRLVINIGVCLQTISFIGASFATKQWQLFLSQGVCFGLGMGFMFIASVSILPQWFLRRRTFATALAAAGSGLGGLAYSLGAGAMIPGIGLGWTFRVLGLATFAMNLIASNLMRDRNKAVGSRYLAFHFPLLKRPEFLLLLAWGILNLLGYVVLLFSLPNFALSVGLSAQQGSLVGALLNLGQALGRPVMGLISDRYGRITMATLFTVACGVLSFAIWIPAINMGVVTFFAIIVGTVAGVFWTTIVPICAEVIGLKDLPTGLSIIWIVMVVPTTVAEPIAVLLKDDSRSSGVYLHAQVFTGVVYLLGSVCLWVLRGWKVGDNERIARQKAIAMAGNRASRSVITNADSKAPPPTAPSTDEKPDAGTESEPPTMPPIGPEISPWSGKHMLPRMTVWCKV